MQRLERATTLVANLARAECFPHAVSRLETLETHISWVILTGAYAYKIKKPVALGFLDFSTLEARRHYCEEELRLNRRYAPDLYLDVVPIGGSLEAPRVGGGGAPLEYAVRMREFAQDALASRLLARAGLSADHLTAFARRLGAFHANAEPARGATVHGTPATIGRFALANFGEIGLRLESPADRDALSQLEAWTRCELARCHDLLLARRAEGRVRECHGDLHLGNIVLLDGELVPFDCIEFNPELRWIDVMSEAAFLMMDLLDRKAPALAWSFINAYLEHTGDYEGLPLLRFYLVYRAMVRAKVHLMRSRQAGIGTREAARLLLAFRDYIRLAETCARPGTRALILTHGLSGCGKSTVARALACELGAFAIRSDVERKRLQGLSALARSGSGLASGLYGEAATAATYARLSRLAAAILQAGHIAVVDAAFLRAREREAVLEAARLQQVAAAVVRVHAPEALLRERITARLSAARDASEATLEVLAHQQAHCEPVEAGEAACVFDVDGTRPLEAADLEPIRAWLAKDDQTP
jgi:uncharacterized protein